MMVTDSSCEAAAAQLHEFYFRTQGAELGSLFTPIPASQTLRKFVGHVIGKRASKRWRLDWHRFGKLRNPLFDAAPLDPVDHLFRKISSKSLIVTGRFHMVCMAMLARAPFIALPGNTHKIEGSWRMLICQTDFPHRYPRATTFTPGRPGMTTR